ncbi:MAG: hypothetical protein F6K17_28150 [Okeania sp. SIO3C4]|nr:hypothetical protein [Okeania sp. SIO3C4]
MNKFIHHDYDENLKSCRLCGRQFKNKPRADNCPGVLIRKPKKGEARAELLSSLNRYVGNEISPVAYHDWNNNYYSKQRNTAHYIYKISETKTIDKTLPEAYFEKDDIPKALKPISEKEMRDAGLELKRGAKSIAVIQRWAKDGKYFYEYWEHYYNEDDTQPGDGLKHVTKGRLKSEYGFSEGWLKKLGEPDLETENPYSSYYSSMKLYKISRVRAFLEQNAQDYAKWLAQREKFVIKSKCLAEKRKITKERQSHQNKLCLECKSSAFMEDGIFCAVHPIKLPDGVPENSYCPDFIV